MGLKSTDFVANPLRLIYTVGMRKSTFIERLAGSILRREAEIVAKAEEYSRTPNRGRLAGIVDELLALRRMILAWRSGSYQPAKWAVAVGIIGLLYFLSPVDLIPDFIPILGYLDDLILYFVLFKLLSRELKRFSEWEARQVVATP